MTETLQANIFFLITSLAVIAVTAGILWLLYYVIPLVKDLRIIAAKLRKASEELEGDFESVRMDFQSLRSSLKEQGTKGRVIMDLALAALQKKFTPKRAKKKPDPAEGVE